MDWDPKKDPLISWTETGTEEKLGIDESLKKRLGKCITKINKLNIILIYFI